MHGFGFARDCLLIRYELGAIRDTASSEPFSASAASNICAVPSGPGPGRLETLIGLEGDEALCFEPGQRLAHRNEAGAEFTGSWSMTNAATASSPSVMRLLLFLMREIVEAPAARRQWLLAT